MSGFSRGKPEAGKNELGLCTARYESKVVSVSCGRGGGGGGGDAFVG